MKKTAASLFALAVLAAGPARAATLAQDTQELRLQGHLDPSTLNGSEIRLGGSYGYFFLDNIQAGGRADFADNDQISSLGLGAFLEYNVDTGNEIMPFGEFLAGFSNVDVEGAGGDDLAGRVELRAGAKFFLAENIAIAVAGVFAYATEKIYPDENQLRDTDVFMELSLRCYF
jgi:hypothetical protein